MSASRPRAAVLVPTHDHPRTLDLAVRSALEQTVGELEVVVVGDGVGDETREVVAALRDEDPRVRFLDLPKGPHHGEAHRGTAIEGTAAEIVCYLCDDDLLLPDHVEQMLELLADADLAHGMNGWFDTDGAWHNYWADLASPEFRAWMLEPGDNAVSLTGTAHTVAAYRRLPHGWRVPPYGVWPDQHMWQQFLAQPWVRAVTGPRVTALQFPSHAGREAWPAERRRAELERWRAEIASAEGRRRLADLIGRSVSREASAEWLRRRQLEAELSRVRAEGAAERWQAHLRAGALQGRLDEIEATRSWRLRSLLKGPREHVLERRQRVELPVERAFELYGDARNLERITPPWLGFAVTTPEPIAMGAGALIEYRLRLHGVPVRWRTRIAAWEPPRRFVDTQLSGPYASWEHEHTFEPAGSAATIIGDRVRYAMPFGPLGEIAHRLIVRRDLERIFDYRREAVSSILTEKTAE